jgi:hypothetical protein
MKYRIQRAEETLVEAEILFANGHFNAFVIRIYYACFYALNGILLAGIGLKDIYSKRILPLAEKERVAFKRHALQRMVQRRITVEDVRSALLTGAVIEEYPDDFPLPSGLIMGTGCDGTHYHVVTAVDIELEMLWIITVYKPGLDGWEEDFKTRRSKK